MSKSIGLCSMSMMKKSRPALAITSTSIGLAVKCIMPMTTSPRASFCRTVFGRIVTPLSHRCKPQIAGSVAAGAPARKHDGGRAVLLDDGRSVECNCDGQPLALVDGRLERGAIHDERSLRRHSVRKARRRAAHGRISRLVRHAHRSGTKVYDLDLAFRVGAAVVTRIGVEEVLAQLRG